MSNQYFSLDNKRFKYAIASIKGSYRADNQDDILVITDETGKATLTGVFDGMGGHLHGKFASYFIKKFLIQEFKKLDFNHTSDADLRHWQNQILKKAKRQMLFYGISHPEYIDMGTTATVCIIFNKKIY